ncbi:MAG: protein kinase [Gemmatimonadetes bacterium]|nr:protein kinase [Gemmatimonadota bacterium]
MTDTDRLAAALADRYRIERELGEGGMATVYLAEDLKHQRQVAIKVLKPELAAVVGAERFLAEIRTTANLQHPGILPLHDSGEVDSFLYYVMPYVEGESLRDRLDREHQLPVDEAVRIAGDVAEALDYAHGRGVIHRDVKPANILLVAGRPVISDFGIALAVGAAGGGRLTETGLSLGTPHYMSPEQATGEQHVGPATDMYALGCVLYEMLVGDPPHTGSTAQAVLGKIITEPPASITQQRKSVPPNVEAAVSRALEKLPADRFRSAKAFAEALANPAFTTGGAAAGAAGGRAVESRGLGVWIRSPWSWAAVAVVVLLAAGLVVERTTAHRPDITYTEKTFRTQAIFSARFAPDGKTLVFSGTPVGEGGTDVRLFVIRPDYPEAQVLGPDSTRLLAVSASGQLALLTHAVFLHHRLYDGTLATMPLGGGAPRELMAHVREADWAPDGRSMAIIHRVDGIDRLEYPVGTVIAKTSGYFSDLRVSPSGDEIGLFDHRHAFDDRGAAEILDRTGRVVARSPVHWAVEGLAWRPDGRTLLYSGSTRTGSFSSFAVFALDHAGHERLRLRTQGGITIHDVAGDGRWLTTQDNVRELVLVRAPGASEVRDMGWLDLSAGGAVNADGSWLMFLDEGVTGGAEYSAMIRKTDGSPAIRLGDGVPIGLSPDGGWVLAEVPFSPPRLMLYPTGPGEARHLDAGHVVSFSNVYANPGTSLSADGKEYFFCGSTEGHAARCFVGAVDGGGPPRAVTPEGTGAAAMSPDARRVAARVDDTVSVYDVGTGERHVVPGLTPDDHIFRWSPDGRSLWVWVYRSEPDAFDVEAVDPTSGRRSPVTRIGLPEGSGLRHPILTSLSDDARAYAFDVELQTSRLFVVEGVR